MIARLLPKEGFASLSDRAKLPSIQGNSFSLSDWGSSDFNSSAIPDRLWTLNTRYVEGAEALGEFGINPAYSAQWGGRKKRKTIAIESGGWITQGTTIDGGEAAALYFKPRNPRSDINADGKIKKVKYETRYGDQASPLLPYVDPVSAAIIFERHKVEPLPSEKFWRTVQRCNLPIAITEGFKKALCLTAHGISAIALRGVACWHTKGSADVYEAIADFATEGRQIQIIFDQDFKPSTVRNVGWEITKLGRALEAKGCKVSVPIWDGLIGKGIDDAISGMAEAKRQDWLDRLLKSAQGFAEWSKVGRQARLLAMLRRLNTLAIAPERTTEGRYLPELPELEQGTIHIVDSGMGSGKTTRISKDWVRAAIAAGWNVVIIAPMNSLGQQTAESCGLPHIRHFDLRNREQIELFETAINSENGVALCSDSEHRLPAWFLFGDRPLLVIMDECNQVTEHIAIGGTLKARQSEIMERHTAILEAAAARGAIVLSEAGVTPRTLDLIKRLSGCDKIRLFVHRDSEAPKWDVELCQGSISGYNVRLLEAIGNGKKLVVTVASQQAGKRLERLIQKRYGDSKAVLRIDSETNEKGTFDDFWRNPNRYLESTPELTDVLIISPSGKSGISITTPGFDEVWGYFSCHHPSMWLQQLARYREPVPRKIFCPKFVNSSSGDETLLYSRSIHQRQKANLQGYRLLYGIEQSIESKEDEALKRSAEIQAAFSDFYCDNQAAIGAEKAVAYEYLKMRLEDSGHRITETKLAGDKEVSSELKKIQDGIWREDAAEIGAIKIEDEHTPEWALAALNGLDVSRENRIRARKVLWRDEFPGVEFDNPDECYEALCLDYGQMRRGILLQARAMNLEASRAADEERVRAMLSCSIIMPHRLPSGHLRAMLIEKTGVLSLVDGREYTESDPIVQQIKAAALKWAKEIGYWLRLQIKPTQTSIEICNKLLGKLGLDAIVVRKEGGRGEQVRVWAINNLLNPTRIKLLKAAIERMGGDSSQIPEQLLVEPDKPVIETAIDLADSVSFNLEIDQEGDRGYESEFLEDPDEGSDE